MLSFTDNEGDFVCAIDWARGVAARLPSCGAQTVDLWTIRPTIARLRRAPDKLNIPPMPVPFKSVVGQT
jgi:hypothetical protein